MKVIKEKDSILLRRRELVLEMDFGNAPTFPRVEIRKRISEKFKVDQDLIAIKKINTKFGGRTLEIICNIYQDKDMLGILEVEKKKDKVLEKEESKEVKEEKPQEIEKKVKEEPAKEKKE